MSMYDAYDKKRHSSIERFLTKNPHGWIDSEHLLEAIVANSTKAIPPLVLEYLKARLDGQIKKPRGRKRKAFPDSFIQDLSVVNYLILRRWLENRRTKYGKKIGCSQFSGKGKSVRDRADFVDTPAGIALEIVSRSKSFKTISHRTIQNLASKYSVGRR